MTARADALAALPTEEFDVVVQAEAPGFLREAEAEGVVAG
jgi:hypothetical protein